MKGRIVLRVQGEELLPSSELNYQEDWVPRGIFLLFNGIADSYIPIQRSTGEAKKIDVLSNLVIVLNLFLINLKATIYSLVACLLIFSSQTG